MWQAAHHDNILDGKRKDHVRFLRDEGHAPGEISRTQFRHRLPVKFHGTLVAAKQTRKHFEECRFARTVRTHQRDKFTGSEIRSNALEDWCVRVAEIQMVHVEYRFHAYEDYNGPRIARMTRMTRMARQQPDAPSASSAPSAAALISQICGKIE